jgi:amidohydrolase
MGRSVEELKDRVCRKVDAEHAALIALSDRIHANPELRFEEHRASAWLAEYLNGAGLAVEPAAYGLATAFAARAGSGRPRVAILCEYDALPGIGHGCGHNLIAAAGAGAASGLASVLGEVEGSVLVLGTPAEEGGGGKILMARQGAFADVDAAMMIHPAGMDLVSMRVLAISALEVEYRGRAAHAAAAPHCGVNALDGLVTAYNAVAQLRQHIRSDERIHGIITEGGQAPNIVPERAVGVFFVRAATEKRLARLKQRVEGCFRAGAAASGAEVSIRKLGEDYVDLLTNAPLADAYGANLARLGRTVRTDVPSVVTGSTDMGNVSKIVPSLHPMIAVSPPSVALHSHEFAQWAASEAGHRAVADGAKALAMTALDVLCDADLLNAVRASFEVDVAKPAAGASS